MVVLIFYIFKIYFDAKLTNKYCLKQNTLLRFMNLLICGDSFAADWTVKYNDVGWPNMLANDFKLTNLAQAGCSEYKIYKQLISANLIKYDAIIVSHTSPNRIYIKSHPVHANDLLHKNSDLIYTDIVEHAKSNKSLKPIVDYFENYFDLEYAMFVHKLLCEKIEKHLNTFKGPVIHVTGLPWDNLHCFNNMLSFEYLSKDHKGLINNYNQAGNEIIYKKIKQILDIKQ